SALALSLHRALETFAGGSGFPLIRARWLARAAHLGHNIRVRRDQDMIDGRFADIDGDGRLLLETEVGTLRIDAGDVFPLDKSGSPAHDER
ncbi:MAG: hypothetical protein ACRC7C_15370, partial [Beijerinckiaceae bacterium]